MRTARKLVTVMGGGPSYAQRVLALAPICYWPLDDAVGSTTARELVAGVAGNAALVTFGVAGPGDGTTGCEFPGAGNQYVDISAVSAAFNPALFSVMLWIRIDAGTWTDGAQRRALSIRADINNQFVVDRNTTNNILRFNYTAGSTGRFADVTFSPAPTTWMGCVITVSKAGNALNVYNAGGLIGGPVSGLGVWVGALDATRTLLGSTDRTAGIPWDGGMARVAIWDRILTTDEIASVLEG